MDWSLPVFSECEFDFKQDSTPKEWSVDIDDLINPSDHFFFNS